MPQTPPPSKTRFRNWLGWAMARAPVVRLFQCGIGGWEGSNAQEGVVAREGGLVSRDCGGGSGIKKDPASERRATQAGCARDRAGLREWWRPAVARFGQWTGVCGSAAGAHAGAVVRVIARSDDAA